jgi:hypothetical protein
MSDSSEISNPQERAHSLKRQCSFRSMGKNLTMLKSPITKRLQFCIYRFAAICLGVTGIFVLLLTPQAVQSRDYWALLKISIVFATLSALYAVTEFKAISSQKFWSNPLTASEFETVTRLFPHFSYVLYLRPLSTDAEIQIHQTFNVFQIVAWNFGMPFIDVQEWLLRCTDSKWRFLSEGGLTTNIRPARLLVTDDWFTDITAAGAKCAVIIMLVGTSDGIVKEFEYFLATHPHKLIIIAPPREGNEKYYQSIATSNLNILNFVRMSPETGSLILPAIFDGKLYLNQYPFSKRSLRAALAARRGVQVTSITAT